MHTDFEMGIVQKMKGVINQINAWCLSYSAHLTDGHMRTCSAIDNLTLGLHHMPGSASVEGCFDGLTS